MLITFASPLFVTRTFLKEQIKSAGMNVEILTKDISSSSL